MGIVTFQVAVSLDGYIAGPDQSEANPLGLGDMDLHRWMFELEVWRRQEGQEDGVVNASTPVVEEAMTSYGSLVMARNMFGGGPRPMEGRFAMERLVGRRASLPHTGLRAHAPRPCTPSDAGRHHIRLRDQRDRVRA